MYREKYGRQTAAAMYQAHKSVVEVSQMLVIEGATAEQARELAQTYHQQHIFRSTEASKKKLKEAGMYRTIGLVLCLGSIFLSFLTYLLSNGSSFIGYYGLLVTGLIALIKGLVDKRKAKAALKQG